MNLLKKAREQERKKMIQNNNEVARDLATFKNPKKEIMEKIINDARVSYKIFMMKKWYCYLMEIHSNKIIQNEGGYLGQYLDFIV